MAFILSLDPSLTAFGFAVIQPTKKPRVVEVGCIKTKVDQKIHYQFSNINRISRIVSEISELINRYNIGFVCFEIPIGSRSNKAAVALALVEGAMVSLFTEKKMSFEAYPPHTVKEVLTGDPFADKGVVLRRVRRDVSNFDVLVKGLPNENIEAASDACAVYLTHIANPDPRYKLPGVKWLKTKPRKKFDKKKLSP